MKSTYIYCHETNEYWKSISKAAKDLGVGIQTLWRHINKKCETKLLNGLNIIKVKDDYCIKCNILLTSDNRYPIYKNKKLSLCKDCRDLVRREGEYRRNYGISLGEYNNLLKKQNNVCAICNEKETAKQNVNSKLLCVDHSHSDGKIRGLLCTKCNKVLGLVNDSEFILKNMINYLKGDKK